MSFTTISTQKKRVERQIQKFDCQFVESEKEENNFIISFLFCLCGKNDWKGCFVFIRKLLRWKDANNVASYRE